MTRYSVPMESLPAIARNTFDHSPAHDPIGIMLSSSGQEQVVPGESLELSITVSNKGDQSAVIALFLDELPVAIQGWCPITQTYLALDPGEGEEVVFRVEVPDTALSGAYRYWLVVDAPNHYPDRPPQRYEQSLQVLPPPQAKTRKNAPTFVVEPTTTHLHPLSVLPGNPLQFTVHVYNRSDQVDRFRLYCTDLPEEWVKIHYPQGFQTPGLAIAESQLDLNPDMEGVISLALTPPPDALSQTMLVTLQLKSDNNPALKLLDVLYIHIEPFYQITTRFRTLAGRIQQQPGLYSVQVSNQGNTKRTLDLQIVGLEGSELCHYTLQPDSLTLAPQQTLTSEVIVEPKHPWKRPLLGGGRLINFEVVATDPDQKPLADSPMPGVLVWEARPWWQILPLIWLLIFSFVGLLWLAWWILIRTPAPAKVLYFAPENTAYEASRGDRVRVGFSISNPSRIQQLELIGQSAEGDVLSGPLQFDFSQGLPQQLEPFCVEYPQSLTCRNVLTDARQAGEYQFTLNVIPKPGRNAIPTQVQAVPISIAPIPLPEVLKVASSAAQYLEAPPQSPPQSPPPSSQAEGAEGAEETAPAQADQTHVARVNWRISHPEQLKAIQVVGRNAEQAIASPPLTFTFQTDIPSEQAIPPEQRIPPELKPFCVIDAQDLVCRGVPTGLQHAGTYTIDVVVIPEGAAPESPIIGTSTPVKIQARPPRLLQFTLNGQPAAPDYLVPIDDGESPKPITLAWAVENNPGTQVTLMPTPGTVEPIGSLSLAVGPDPGKLPIMLQVTNSAGETVTRSLTITTYDPTPDPPPTVVVNTGEDAADAADAAATEGAGGVPENGPAIGPPASSRPGTVSPTELPPELQ